MTRKRWIALVVFIFLASRFVAIDRGGAYDRDAGSPIWVFDHGYHAGLTLSRESLSKFGGDKSQSWLLQFPDADWFEFGWGDAGFYFEVPTFEDVTAKIAAKALFLPSDSVVHVATGAGSPWDVFSHSEGVEIPVTDMALRDILGFVERGAQSSVPLGPGLYGISAFYEGQGKYHLFQTCNSWVSQALRAGGLASAPGPSVASLGLVWDLKRRYW
ncbi:hypothetical protein shim_09900 [Shimia sp. SK013]|uniref:DUF2459 domain-containing protein n=1 Tax=Shimia sp. SK013 TaxID=1389006 RepID=UPI0006B4DF04|nr:DUF2459 domain-containing protein [Shimia sp. SK013]KPA22703.1 hypothetical protein shim_09900 [Shimia sp. SK013]